jgi:amino acid permease
MLLFAIEGRTALLASQSRQAAAWYLTAKAAEERERQFLEAIAAGRNLPLLPAIQDLERFASQWSPLLPEDPGVRAALTHLLGQKYRFTHRDVPDLRSALGLEDPAVQEAYRRHYHQDLESIYAPQTGAVERLRWIWTAFSSRIESLPTFWTTYILTLPGAAGLLALPIALSGVGLPTGIALIVIFGLINMLTVAALAEAVARSGTTRFGLGFLGQLVQEYLGRPGFILLSTILALNNFFILIIFYLGVAGTLQDATSLPQGLWVAVIFGVCLYFLTRRSLNATVATTIVIVLINLFVLIVIPLLALPHLQLSNLSDLKLPFVGIPFTSAIWQLALGVMLSTYFSHILVVVYAPVVIKRDPGARSWVWGSIAAIFTLMLIACSWMVVVNGAIPAATLASTTGTVLTPLAEQTGPVVLLLGSVLVILSLGLASIQISLVLYYQSDESLPAQSSGGALSRLGERARFLLSISPVVAAFLLTEWVAFARVGSFTTFLSIESVLVLPLLGGIFPVLLLAATRRKGDYVPALVFRLLGNPLVLVGLYLVFLAIIFLHGLLLWDLLVTKILAIAVGVIVLGVTILMIRRGALNHRLVIELLEDQRPGGGNFLQVTDSGRPANMEACLTYRHRETQVGIQGEAIPDFQALQSVTLRLPASKARELKVWVHRITPEGRGESLPASIEMENGAPPLQFDLEKSGGQLILPLSKTPGLVKLNLKNPR